MRHGIGALPRRRHFPISLLISLGLVRTPGQRAILLVIMAAVNVVLSYVLTPL